MKCIDLINIIFQLSLICWNCNSLTWSSISWILIICLSTQIVVLLDLRGMKFFWFLHPLEHLVGIFSLASGWWITCSERHAPHCHVSHVLCTVIVDTFTTVPKHWFACYYARYAASETFHIVPWTCGYLELKRISDNSETSSPLTLSNGWRFQVWLGLWEIFENCLHQLCHEMMTWYDACSAPIIHR